MIHEPAITSGVDTGSLPVPLSTGVRVRQARDCLLLLAPDGITAIALHSTDVAALTATSGPERDELLHELADAGIIEGSVAVDDDSRLRLTRSGLEISGLSHFATRAHRWTRWIPTRIATAIAIAVVLVAGVVLAAGSARTSAADADLGPLTAALLLFITGAVLAAVHELGHALVLVRAGGRIGGAGFGFHWGAPSFFVDSTAALFLPKRQRIAQAAAGVATEVVLAAALVVAAALTGSSRASFIAGSALLYALSSLVVNGAPVLGLDGSLIMSDLLDRPTLPTGSGQAQGRFAIVYRSLDAVIGLVAIAASTWLWWMIWRDVLAPLWNGGLTGRAVVGLTTAPTLAAILVGVASLTRR